MRRTPVASAPLALCGCLVLAIGCAPSAGDARHGRQQRQPPGRPGAAGNERQRRDDRSSRNHRSRRRHDGQRRHGSGTSGTTGTAGSIAGRPAPRAAPAAAAAALDRRPRRQQRGARRHDGQRRHDRHAPGTGAGGTGSANCTFTQSSTISPMIATVGIVTWSTTLAGATSAKIDFGLTTSYGMTAPVSAVAREQPDAAARHEDVSACTTTASPRWAAARRARARTTRS